MERRIKLFSGVLSLIGYLATVGFLDSDLFRIRLESLTEVILIFGPLIPFAITALAAALAPSRVWSWAVATVTATFVVVGTLIYVYYFLIVRDAWSFFMVEPVMLVEAVIALILLVAVIRSRILMRKRASASIGA